MRSPHKPPPSIQSTRVRGGRDARMQRAPRARVRSAPGARKNVAPVVSRGSEVVPASKPASAGERDGIETGSWKPKTVLEIGNWKLETASPSSFARERGCGWQFA